MMLMMMVVDVDVDDDDVVDVDVVVCCVLALLNCRRAKSGDNDKTVHRGKRNDVAG
jgi:hypothetical protein